MKRILLPLCIVTAWGCNLSDWEGGDRRKTVSYSYACLDSAVGGNRANRTIDKTSDFLRDLIVDADSITDQVQNEYGDLFHQDAIETRTFILLNDPEITRELHDVMTELLAVRDAPSQLEYSIYALDDPQVNAFTFGGRIYVTKGMYDKCGGKTALLFSIIGHEIGHSEKGHIKKTIQEMRLSEKIFGEDGLTVFQIKRLLTASFNQKNELEADYYGTDLAYKLSQDVCSAVIFWKSMAAEENQYSGLEDFFRSHPFSSLRAQCLEDHIRTNFGRSCEK